MKQFLTTKIHRLLRQEEGLAFIEFAFVLPLLLLLFFGCVETTRYVLAVQKLEKTANQISNVVTQTDPTATTASQFNTNLATLMSAMQYMMFPYDTMSGTTNTNLRVIVSDVLNTNLTTSSGSPPTPVIQWQFCSSSSLTNASKLGTTGGSVTDSKFGAAGFPTAASGASFHDSMQSGEEVVVTEIYFAYQPISPNLMPTTTLYRSTAYMPRLGQLYASSYAPPCN